MVQVIGEGRVKPKSFGQQIGEGFSRSLQGTSEHLFNQHQSEQQALRDLLVKQHLLQTEYGLKGDLEGRKQSEKFEQQKKLFEEMGLTHLFGNEQKGKQLQGNAPQNQQDMPSGEQQPLIPEEKIYAAEAIGQHGLAQQMRERNKQIIAEKHHEETVGLKKKEAERKERLMSPEYQREHQLNTAQAKVDSDYNKQLQQSASQHRIKTDTLNNLDKLNEKGVTGKPYEKLLEKAGLVAYTSEGRREFSADVKNLITDIRSILGAQFTGFEFQTILNAYPSADFSQGANRAIIKNLKAFQDIRHQELEIAKQLKKENAGKIPLDFQSQVNERLEKYAAGKMSDIKSNTYEIMKEELGIPKGNILMFSPDGEPLDVTANEVERYESLGATIYPVGE